MLIFFYLSKKGKVFSIKDEEKTYSFSANSGDEAKDWLTALLKVLRKLNQNAKSLEKTESHERTLSLSMPQYNVNPKSNSNNSPIRSSSPQRGSSVG